MSKLTVGMIRRIKAELSRENPTVWVGKKQVSEELLKEIEKQLEKREIVKIKILKSALGEVKSSEMASTIAKQTESTLVEVRGHTFVLYKRRQRGLKK